MIGKRPGSSKPSGATFADRPRREAPPKAPARKPANRLRTGPDPRTQRPGSGNRPSGVGKAARFTAWRRHHLAMAADSLARLLAAPVGSLMTWAVIAIALSLPVALYVFLNNAQLVSSNWDGTAQISLYLQDNVRDDAGRRLTQELQLRPEIAETRYLSREQALAEFKEFSGFGEALSYLDDNPLPAVIIVRPSVIGVDAQQALVQQLQLLPEVEEAQLDLAWVKRLYHIMELGQRMITALGLLLGLAVLLVVGNTIRLAIENRRQEIVVVKLIGATDAFVRRPFLYTGIWYGLGGGIMAWLLINLSLFWLDGPVRSLASAYASDFSLIGLGLQDSLLLLFGSTLLGWIGAWIAVGRHLGKIEPR
ncbi:permease-like cell division protein FtsX [Marinospirillum alkaliphilum]|uniref:Cell division protein FtsX n=1 Tax=Marinospirillum alkaliphilum DSM 21637 TaxID=1122209 RepID=A0A1K1VZN1_9GAMM|nr:permease-like cell division protein FtsX [Marinospirillum alkaliphilum]SFX30132.1 cell division protein FtsX [Marinospirillum alkaliphilum DSM 21637]